ncbi:MAG: hypothetical protein IH599_10145, partial [Bacteroidales bacterium]|nr:hypothetical protein [Bacteroidales bacterium]
MIQAADSSLSHLLHNHNPGLTARLASPELSSWLQKLSAGHQDTTAFWLLGYEQAWVAGRDQTQLRKLIADLRSNRTIEGSLWFEQLQEKLPDEASLWGRRSIAQSGSREKKSLPLSLAWAVQPGNHPLISLVISSESPGNGREESRPILTAGTITHRPFAIWDPAKKRYDILVFDNTHTATLFTPDGEVLWDYPLDGVPLGDIQLLDPRRNGQWLILFNTASRIYLLDRKGYDVEGFPLDLSPMATNPVAAIDYEGRKDYRIFVATADGYIRNLDIRGKEISSWTRPRMESPVHLPLQHLVMHDRDYLVIASEDGQVLMTDRKGAERVSVKRAFENSTQTPFFLQRIEGENRLITTDRQGKVQAILRNGKVFSSHLETFSDRHKFCYAPFSTDRASDYIFLDENRLV